MTKILDHGYVELIEYWGSDERIIESARMSTQKGFLGWGPKHASTCVSQPGWDFDRCSCGRNEPGDEKLLKYLWDHQHGTPFEMAGLTVEIKAPIMVFREWHRHRTGSYNEMSARYIPLPNENYVPDAANVLERAELAAAAQNKQTRGMGTRVPTMTEVLEWLDLLGEAYEFAQGVYERGLDIGIPKELARLPVPVGRYSAMRASANLRNWLAFLKLRCHSTAQWEIRQFSNAVATLVKEKFPRTYDVSKESCGLP